MADFRRWIDEQLAHVEEPPPDEGGPEFDADTILRLFVGLRQDINLQTKAARAALERLDATDEAMPAEPPEKILTAIVDTRDALGHAQRRAAELRSAVLPRLAEMSQAPPIPPVGGGWFGRKSPDRRWRDWADSMCRMARDVGKTVDGLLAGYDMSVARLDRLIGELGLEPITAEGRPFDPESMQILELVTDADVPDNHVTDEVRPGYRLNGRLLRYAQVKVAKSVEDR